MLNKTSRANRPASKHNYFAEKVGFLKGIWRYLGFQKVKPVYVRPFFFGQHNRHRQSDKPLRNRRVEVNRKIHSTGSVHVQPDESQDIESEHSYEQLYEQGMFDDIFRKFQGFRATETNVRKLADELIACLEASPESEEEKNLRVELSLTLCGLGKIRPGHHILTSGSPRRSISTARLTRLDQYLHMSLNELTISAHNSGIAKNQNINTQHAQSLESLTEQGEQESLTTGKDIVTRMKMCQNYLLYGEGRRVLDTCGFSDVDRLQRLLPSVPESIEAPNIILSVQSLLSTITNEQVVPYDSLNVRGIDFVPGVAKKDYQPDNPQHRTLVILQELQNIYDGLYSGYAFESLEQGRKPESDLDDQKTNLQRILTGAAHSVMKNAFPEECNETSYQQVHLKTASGQLRWNSDGVQPRGGWRERDVFEPARLPTGNL